MFSCCSFYWWKQRFHGNRTHEPLLYSPPLYGRFFVDRCWKSSCVNSHFHSCQHSVSLLAFLAGGGVLLVEAMLFENRRGPVMAQIFSLNMLVQAEGRERPPSEYTHMLNKSGFSNVQVCRTGKSYDAILAIRWARTEMGTGGRGVLTIWESKVELELVLAL